MVVEFDVDTLIPQVTWGTSPGMGTDITSTVPVPQSFQLKTNVKQLKKHLNIWVLTPGTPMNEI